MPDTPNPERVANPEKKPQSQEGWGLAALAIAAAVANTALPDPFPVVDEAIMWGIAASVAGVDALNMFDGGGK